MKRLGFGAMHLPLTNENDEKSIDINTTREMINLFMEKGFNYFDTAYPYHLGESEKVLKKELVDKYPRESFILTSKLPLFPLEKEEYLEIIFNEQLENCGVEYFDYYLLHNVSTWTKNAIYNIDSYNFIRKKKKEGKIKHIGISFHDDAELLEKTLKEFPEIKIVQL